MTAPNIAHSMLWLVFFSSNSGKVKSESAKIAKIVPVGGKKEPKRRKERYNEW
eukprot:CAMPEP_0201504726 /NCGR_PEP_ID=MMETSP0151_2-20130828/85373_1 /ASSEMBLY_ACC=CAM_ASM_000257 /TAXON_ID=200890 /ORGANISM="Paramoeba atlantica, Strain 621/1 / CCAP 1560/9" /LENGTH=52 /DNA_ID=CAMNT_0047898509 /DNA_START=554 /DNA_END=712 /DNA_ORIENTATION=+